MTALDSPSPDFNLAQAICRHAQERPDAPAVVFQGRSLSYWELAERAAAVAERLRQAPGWPTAPNRTTPRVGVLASRSLDACVALIGACWAGATYVPLGLKLPEERLRSLLVQCELTAVISDADGDRLLTPALNDCLPATVVRLSDLPATPMGAATRPAPMTADETAYIIFTSGTTGTPKGVMISAASARHYISHITAYLGLTATDRVLETCELTFDFSVHNMFPTWEAGAALHILPANWVMNAVKFARQQALTVWNSVPSLVGMLRQLKTLPPGALPDLRLTVFGGEQLPEGSVQTWQSAAPNSRIVNLYGPTEATVFCLAQPIEEPLPLTPGRGVMAIGTPLPGCSARIIDPAGNPVADGVQGELAIGGVQLAQGYFAAADLTARRFPTLAGERWYRTGDLAYRDADGTFHCLGRIDNQVKVLGYRVELEDIDAHLRAVTGIELVGSVAWPIVDGMARGIVSFVAAQELATDPIILGLKARLPAYMVPNHIHALAHLPTNASGKVDRNALRRHLETGSIS